MEKLSARLWNYGDRELARAAEALEARVEVLEQFVRAHDAVEEGLLDFDLAASTVVKLRNARESVGLLEEE